MCVCVGGVICASWFVSDRTFSKCKTRRVGQLVQGLIGELSTCLQTETNLSPAQDLALTPYPPPSPWCNCPSRFRGCDDESTSRTTNMMVAENRGLLGHDKTFPLRHISREVSCTVQS